MVLYIKHCQYLKYSYIAINPSSTDFWFSKMEQLPGILLTISVWTSLTIPKVPTTTGKIDTEVPHMWCISSFNNWYFVTFSVYFKAILLSQGQHTSISKVRLFNLSLNTISGRLAATIKSVRMALSHKIKYRSESRTDDGWWLHQTLEHSKLEARQMFQ